MGDVRVTRRAMLGAAAGGVVAVAGASGVAGDDAVPTITVSAEAKFELSPYLYMQFMEPLGTTDGSVEASWDHLRGQWRGDLVEATSGLAPPMMRWGGLFSAYYRWREGVGPRAGRVPMHNLVWGGVETNQVGTAEFLDFCRQVRAEPLMCVNFGAEGNPLWVKNLLGEARAGDAREAAEWVSYCNDPANAERIGHGLKEPMPIKHWQLGNETSYGPQRFKRGEAIERTIEFATAMRKVDPSLKLIAWGDSGWAPAMIERAGEHVDYVAFHHLFDPGEPCSDQNWRRDPAATWDVLMGSVKRQEKKLVEMRQQVGPRKFPLAMTECHFTMKGRNRCDLNSAWATGVAYARFMNLHVRHGDVLKIANLGDFCGTRWQTNVVMLPTPGGKAYVMPVGKVAALYRQKVGTHFVECGGAPEELDVVASRVGDAYFVHVVNTSRSRGVTARMAVEGVAARAGRVHQIAVEPWAEITSAADDPMRVVTREVDLTRGVEFPAASVTVVELRG